MSNVLVAGGAGFIGSNYLRTALDQGGGDFFVCADKLTYAGSMENVRDLMDHARFAFAQADICDGAAMAALLKQYDIDTVINFAAQTHVDRSIATPDVFFHTNVIGAQTLMETARRYWFDKPDARFIQISTDEVYGALPETGRFTEASPLMPRNPYAASKAAADLAALSYHHTYGFPAIITRSGNNYGPYQHPEKFIPRMILCALENEPLPVYGDGLHVRDWLHVTDHCAAIEAVRRRGQAGQVYNIGADNEQTNLDVARTILSALGKPETLIRHVDDRPGHDRRYALNSGKITSQLQWSPRTAFAEAIADTIRWYRENPAWRRKMTFREE